MGKRVLCIDDDEVVQQLVQEGLTTFGHTVRIAEDGAVGLELLNAEGFDVILCDIMMPRMDGYAFLDALQNSDAAATPVIVISSRSGPLVERVTQRHGAALLMPKPLALFDLNDAVNELGDLRRTPSPASVAQ
jgi:CheY-like chemotaxis protein